MRKLLIAVAVVLGICVAGTVLANLGDDDHGRFVAATKTPATPAADVARLLADPTPSPTASPSATPTATTASPRPKATTAKPKPVAKPTTRKPKPRGTKPAVSTSFANCTEMRKVYPNGVPAGHPAYRSKMDRDHDGRACER